MFSATFLYLDSIYYKLQDFGAVECLSKSSKVSYSW